MTHVYDPATRDNEWCCPLPRTDPIHISLEQWLAEREVRRRMTDPERLRAVADWLDITDPIVAAYRRTQPESEERERALECVEGAEMQADLRGLADRLDGKEGDDPRPMGG